MDDNNVLIYINLWNSDELFLETYDTTLNKWEKDINFTGKRSKDFENFDDWVIDKNSGKSIHCNKNTTGQAPSLRSGHTAVLTSDGRIIIYGGTSKNLAATPSIVVLNTSNYEWSTPTEVNPIGPLESHTSTIVDNYMVTSFGTIVTKKNIDRGPNKNVYKLDISNPSTYKWSILSTYNENLTMPSTSPFPSPSTFPPPSTFPHKSSSNNLTIAISVTTGILLLVHFIFWWVFVI
ncbi:hypothetical protein C2G38_2147599 [Gigaspora rosea]|uniref:Galactose oxidase n=1 Tax=Gigaspora rosea TaxID=44941 RepID=A0A397UDY7_9GLOM|nr:hypothetical protein C2G38_2147599 [Gigaspora rosea]